MEVPLLPDGVQASSNAYSLTDLDHTAGDVNPDPSNSNEIQMQVDGAPAQEGQIIDDAAAKAREAEERALKEQEAREAAERAAKKAAELAVQRDLYMQRCQARLNFLQPSPSYSTASPAEEPSSSSYSYNFTPLYNIPQATIQTNALDAPPCSSHIFTGGSDGYIRRYSWYASIRKRPAPGSSPLGAVLKGYWENPSISTLEALAIGDATKARFGPASITGTVAGAVAVHSLVVQKEELFALAGSAEGVINLFGVRIDEGQVRASLGMTASGGEGVGHKKGKPVSALALTHNERAVISGGWDTKLLEWSLDDGRCTREYTGHSSQIVSIQLRPLAAGPFSDAESQSTENALDLSADSTESIAEDGSALANGEEPEAREEGGLSDLRGAKASEDNDDLASTMSYDPLFDDEGDAASGQIERSTRTSPAAGGTPSADSGLSLPGFNLSSVLQSSLNQTFGASPSLATIGLPNPAAPPPPKTKLPPRERPSIPAFTDTSLATLSNDLFVSLSIDGECILWDRKAAKGKDARRLPVPKGVPLWASCCAWAPSGMTVYVGRRDASVTVYDLRGQASSSVCLPSNSGKVTAVYAFKDERHLLIGSSDTVRLWDLHGRKFKVLPGTIGGVTSMGVDAREKYLFAAYGSKGWLPEPGKEEVATFEITKANR